MKRKIYAAFICIALIAAAFAGCISLSGSSPTDSTDQNIFGQVSAIDGGSITLALVSNPGVNSGNYQGGQRPQGSGQPWPSGQRPQGSFGPRASGQGQYSDGQFPSGGIRGGMTLSGETKTITVTDNTAITKGGMGMGQQDTGSDSAPLSDITVGSYLQVTMTGDNVTSVVIMQFENRGGNADASPSPSGSPSLPPSPKPPASPSPGGSAAPGLGLTVH